MAYTVALPDGRTVEFPDEVPKDKAAAIIRQQFPALAPQTTALGHAKELVKGVVPGAVGMLETAATGASALLPDEMEKAAREKIASVASAAKAPFAAAPGYEEAVSRKIGEGIGSTAPFFALGPLGMAGRAAGAGLGVAAGAGEARQNAEQEGATGSQRALATALGAPTGLLDILAPEIKPFKGLISTALVRGGVEGATEAAQKVAQNLIAKGVYNPKQDVLAGSGEEGAYGAGVGALTSLILDMAIPGRHRGRVTPTATPQTAPPQPGAQLPPEAPTGTQGQLFTEEEMGKKVPPPPAAPAAPTAEPAVPEGQMDLGLDYARRTGDVTQELERLKQQEQAPEVKARVAQLETDLQTYSQLEVERLRAEKADAAEQARADRAGQVAFPALANAPDLLAQSDEVKARTQGELFPGEDLGTKPAEEPVTEPTLRSKKEAAPKQRELGLRRNPEGQPTTFGQPEPTFTSEDVLMTAVPIRKGMESWIDKNVIGSTRTQLLDLIERDPTLVQGNDQRAKLLRSLTAAEVPAFKEQTNVTRPQSTQTQPIAQPRTSEPSVGVSGQPAAPNVSQPGAGVPGAASAPVAPVGRGLVPAGQPAGKGTQAQGTKPTAVNPFAGLVPAQVTKALEVEKATPSVKSTSPFDISGPSILTKDQTSKGTRYAEGTDTGRTVADLQQEIESATGKNADALRAMLKSGKVKLEERHPTMKGVRGLFDGKAVTLYSSGIAEGNALSTALHEVGAHLGMAKMLGQKQYDAVISKILDWMQLKDGSLQAQLAQAAYRKIPIRDMKRGPEVFGDEAVAYFVEELAAAEAAGKIPKIGPMRALWNQIKTSMLTAINKALGTSFGLNDLTPQQIGMMADAAMQREAKTGVEPTAAEDKQMFAVAPGTEALVDSMGPLDAQKKSSLTNLINGFKTQADVNYAVKFRTQTADAAATVEHRLRERFDGAVRDSLGKFNPMGLYRQAQDYAKTLLEYFQQGSLVKDPVTGLWKVDTVAKVRPPAEVYAKLDAWATKNGYDRERGTQIASRILEGVRLDAMRTANRTQGTEFLLHLKDNEIDQLVREYNADPDLKEMSKLMDEARLAMVDNMVAVGRLSPEQGEEWKKVAGYVPFDRIEDFATSFNKIKKVSNKGLAQVGKLPELVGSLNRPVGNVFDNYLNTLGWMVGQTMKTDGTVQTLRSLEDIGQAKFLGRSPLGRDNTVGAYVKGEMMYWELPSKYDVLAFKDLNPPKAGWLRALGSFSNVLRKSVTVLPPFALKQVTDDVQRAIMTSGVKNPGALLRMSLTNFPKLALAELRGIQHPMVREFGALGLTGEYDFEAGKPATSLLKDLGYKPRGKFETLLHRLDGITRASDLAVRKAIYDQTMKETNDQLLAQTRAREFINFRRRGASDFVGAMVTVVPFFNAYIQGMDVLYRAASGKDSSSSIGRAHARRMFWSRAATVMMLSSLYALGKDDDDEDYKEMDLRTRDGNWILPGGVKIPVPGELGAIFKVIPERVVEYMKRQGTPEEQTAWEATRTALTYMYEQYLGRSVPVPQAIKPVLEAWANKSFLTGRELEGIHHKAMDPSQRRTDQTSELAQAIANFSRDTVGVEVSPIMIDNTLRGYFGSTAALLTATTDSLLNPTRVDRPLHKWALISNYMYDPVGTRRMTEFYEAREEVGKANATLRELMKTDMDRAEAYANAHQDELALESAVNSTLEQLENTRAYRKFLNSPDGAKEMPADQREKELQEIKKMEIELVGWIREAKAELRKPQ